MNIVIGYAGQAAEANFSNVLSMVKKNIQEDLPLNIEKSADNQAIFAIKQPGGFFPLGKPFYDPSEYQLCMLQGYFWYKAHFPKTEGEAREMILIAAHDLNQTQHLNMSENYGGVFNLIRYAGKEKRITICNDYSGILPLYYSLSKSGVFFCSHLRSLAQSLGKAIDPISIMQHTAFHYTIGNRTLFKDIFRVNPGETLIYDIDRTKINFRQPQGYYSHITPYKNDMEAVEALYTDYMVGVSELSATNKVRGLMLSGGLDSRLVALGFHKYNDPIVAVTLGEPGNFEVSLAKKVSKRIDATLALHTPIDDCQLTYDRIEKMSKVYENVNFPYMESSALVLKKLGAETLSTGYGGETFIGGQAFSVFGQNWSKKERLKNALIRSLGFEIKFMDMISTDNLKNFIRLVVAYHKKSLNAKKIIFNREFQSNFLDLALLSLENDISSEVSRYAVNSSGTIQQVCERFWLEHHVLKQFGKQEHTLSRHLPLVLPILHHSFLVRCSNLAPERKVDHGIYLKLVKKHYGDLKFIPTSNIPLPLSFPTPMLWLTRAIRSVYDQKQVENQIASAGKYKKARCGWPNFELWFRQGDFLDNVGEWIDPKMFDKNILLKQLERWKNWNDKIFSGQDLMTLLTLSQIAK